MATIKVAREIRIYRHIPTSKLAARGPVGDYALPTDKGVSNQVLAARGDLMAAVARVCPQFFQSLRAFKTDFDKHEALLRQARAGWYWHPTMSFQEWERHSQQFHEKSGPLSCEKLLGPRLRRWARNFRAETEDWILAGAVEALSYWTDHDFENFRDARRAFSMGGVTQLVVPRAFRFTARPWHPESERWSDYEKILQQLFQRALARYERRIKRRVPTRFRSAPKRWSAHHFKWFARCQFAGERPIRVLADLESIKGDSTTVTKALRRVATLAAWQGPLRHLRTRSGK